MVGLGRQTALTRHVFHTLNRKRDKIMFILVHFVSACDLGNSQHVIRSLKSRRTISALNFFSICSHSCRRFYVSFFALASRYREMHRCVCVCVASACTLWHNGNVYNKTKNEFYSSIFAVVFEPIVSKIPFML